MANDTLLNFVLFYTVLVGAILTLLIVVVEYLARQTRAHAEAIKALETESQSIGKEITALRADIRQMLELVIALAAKGGIATHDPQQSGGIAVTAQTATFYGPAAGNNSTSGQNNVGKAVE